VSPSPVSHRPAFSTIHGRIGVAEDSLDPAFPSKPRRPCNAGLGQDGQRHGKKRGYRPERMPSSFHHYPERPRAAECQNAFVILCNAHDASSSFLETFATVRAARKAVGASTDEEQDLLRAALVFAAAGMDSMVKQLIRDALAAVVDGQPGAQLMFQQFIERQIVRGGEDSGSRLLAEVLADRQPRAKLIQLLVYSLTSGSLQSHEEVMRVGAHFDIPSATLVPDVPRLQSVFRARNEIVHEMDVDFAQPNRNRRPRAKDATIRLTNEVFRVAHTFLTETDARVEA
jgi:hypothetical protein